MQCRFYSVYLSVWESLSEIPISVFLFFCPALLRLHQCVDNWMCMILNDVLMSAYVYLAPSVTHLHIHNKHKHAQSRFMHGTVPDPFKARGSYKVYLVMQGYCALFELHCLN